VAAAGLALALYVRTLAPGVFVADFAEFQYLPARLGLAHPNGFPFYMLLGKLWSLLPVGALAWRMNLFSALAGALAVGLTVAFVQRLSRRALPGLAAGALLALSPTFWLYSLAAERYTLNLALLIACIWSAWEAGEDAPRRRGERGGGDGERKEERRTKEKADGPERRRKENTSSRSLRAAAVRNSLLSVFFLALGLATHPSDALLLPFWLLFLWLAMPTRRWQWRFWLRLAGIGGAVQLLYLYAPWRWLAFSDWPLLPGIGRSSAVYAGLVHVWYAPGPRWELMAQYVFGLGGYAAGLAGGGWRAALARAADLFPYWLADVPWPVTGAGLFGLFWLARRQWRLAGMLAGFAGLLFVMVAYIQQGKNDAYLLPAFWVAFVAEGMAVDGLLAAGRRLGAVVRPLATVVLGLGWVAAVGFLLISAYPRLDHSRWNESQTWWDETLALPIESGAGLLGHWSDLTPFWYLQAAEGTRPDLVGLFPPDPEAVIRPWLEAGRALYLAAPLHGWAETLASDFRLTPWGGLTRIDLPGAPPRPCPLDGPALETSAGWPFAVSAWRLDAPVLPADSPRLWLCWQARTSLPRRTFLSITLAPAEGGPGLTLEAPLINPWYPQAQLEATSRGLGLLPFDLPLGRAPGVYRVAARPFYFREADGQTVYWPGVEPAALGSLRLPPQTGFRRLALDDETASPLLWRAGPLGLRAWRVSAQAVRPGDPVQVTTLWQAADVTDASVALALRVRDGWGRLLA